MSLELAAKSAIQARARKPSARKVFGKKVLRRENP
jgi:hypothetical protein